MRIPMMALLCSAATLLGPSHHVDAGDGPVQVFILGGQSNMVGHGKTLNGLNPDYDQALANLANADKNDDIVYTVPREIPGGIGSLAWAVQTMPSIYGFGGTNALVDANGDWLVRDDVNVYARMEVFEDSNQPSGLTAGVTRTGAHTVGFGKANSNTQKWNGPEYGFGQVVGNALDQDVLIIKVATGGTSLQTKWRSPTAVSSRGGNVGYMWDHMLDTVNDVLTNLDSEFPEYTGKGYEIAGFGWHQGWNDRTTTGVAEYEANLRDLITDVRTAFSDEDLPFIVANTGIGGEDVSGVGLDLINAQNAVGDMNNVEVVDTRSMYRDSSESPSTLNFHWNHNGITHYEIGAGMGDAMLTLVPEPSSLALLGLGGLLLTRRRRGYAV